MDLTTLIICISTFILGTCGFLFKHTLKNIFVDPSSNPKLFFENNETSLSITVGDTSSPENCLESRVKREMEQEYRIYMPKPLDPFKNPMLTVQDYAFKAEMLNICKELYLTSKEEFIKRRIKTEIIKQRWQLVEIFIVNTGQIATKHMRININVPHNILYPSSKIKVLTAKCYQPPTGTESFHRDVIVSPDFYLKEDEYQYLEETDEPLIQGSITYDKKEPIRQGNENRVKLASFYIDLSKITNFEIKWKIYEDTLGKNGNHGVLKIKFIDKSKKFP